MKITNPRNNSGNDIVERRVAGVFAVRYERNHVSVFTVLPRCVHIWIFSSNKRFLGFLIAHTYRALGVFISAAELDAYASGGEQDGGDKFKQFHHVAISGL